jgi:DNA modification methylase
MNQTTLFDIEPKFEYTLNNGLEPVEVSFRDIVREISDTGYLTHSIYYYPAKFIPQVVRFCLNEFTQRGDVVIDPFAGSGTVGLEAYITGRNAILLDINYLLEIIIPLKIYQGNNDFNKNELYWHIKQIQNETDYFIPDYANIRYWYPPEMFEVISKYWAGVHKLEEDIYKFIIQASLVRISKLFSWAEHRTPKLFRSKFKKRYIENLLQMDWKKELDNKLFSFSYKYYSAVKQLKAQTRNFTNTVEYYAGVDSAKFKLRTRKNIDALITSPPYLQAQEYIRTSKLDLYWLGYTEKQIKEIAKFEIPYRKASRIVKTETLDKVRKQIKKESLLKTLDSYFDHTIASLENNMNLLKHNGKACIFVGNPKIDGVEIETWRILTEYFSERSFKFEIVFNDIIKTRQLFGQRNNKNPEGIKSEYLLVMSRM